MIQNHIKIFQLEKNQVGKKENISIRNKGKNPIQSEIVNWGMAEKQRIQKKMHKSTVPIKKRKAFKIGIIPN